MVWSRLFGKIGVRCGRRGVWMWNNNKDCEIFELRFCGNVWMESNQDSFDCLAGLIEFNSGIIGGAIFWCSRYEKKILSWNYLHNSIMEMKKSSSHSRQHFSLFFSVISIDWKQNAPPRRTTIASITNYKLFISNKNIDTKHKQIWKRRIKKHNNK